MSTAPLLPGRPILGRDALHAAGFASAPRAVSDAAYWGPRAVGVILIAWIVSPALGVPAVVAGLTALAYATLLVGRSRPALALFGVATLCTLEPLTTSLLLTGGLLRWNTLNYVLLAVALANLPVLRRVGGRHAAIAATFTALLVVELLVSPDATAGLQDVLGVTALFGLLVYGARAVDGEAWYWMGIVAGTVGAAGTVAFLSQAAQLPTINPNAWSYLPLTALFALCLALPFARGGRAAAVLALAAVNAACVVLSASRGSMLIAAAVVCYLVAAARGAQWRLALVGTLAAAVAVAALAFPADDRHALERVELLADSRTSAVDRTSGRAALLEGGLVLFERAPLGVGTGGFARAWTTLDAREGLPAWGRNEAHIAHAGWLKVLVENGVPGVLLLAAFVATFLARGVRSAAWERRCLGVLATAVLGLAFVSTEFQSKGLWFFAAGVMSLLAVTSGAAAQPDGDP